MANLIATKALGLTWVQPSSALLIIYLLGVTASGLAAGLVVSRVSVRRPLVHALVLALILAPVGGTTPTPGQPSWYPWLLMAVWILGVVIAARVDSSRSRTRGERTIGTPDAAL